MMAVQPSDLDLILNLRAGQETAFEQLLERYQPLLTARTQAFASPVNEREDLMQEGRLAIFLAAQRWQQEQGVPFAAYVERVLQNRLIDAERRSRQQKHRALNEALSLDEARGEAGNALDQAAAAEARKAPEDRLIFVEEALELRDFMRSKLSAREKAVIDLQMTGASYRMMADVLKTTPKAIDSALQRARRKIREGLWERRV